LEKIDLLNMTKRYNGFNNGRDTTEGIGGKTPIEENNEQLINRSDCEHLKTSDQKSGMYICAKCGMGLEGKEYDRIQMERNKKAKKYIKREATDLYNALECVKCKGKITYDELLSKYGPEGLYEIANKLKQIADEDVKTALRQCDDNAL